LLASFPSEGIQARQAWRWLKRNAAAAVGVIALGIAAGLTAILTPFALTSDNDMVLYPSAMGLLNPVRWMQLARQEPAVRYGVFAAAVVLALGIGWMVRLIARPRTARAALAAAAGTGLVATLFAFSILGPVSGAEAHRFTWRFASLRLHPVSDPFELAESTWRVALRRAGSPDALLRPESAQTELDLRINLNRVLEGAGSLEKDFPPEDRPGVAPLSTEELYGRAVLTNEVYAAVTVGWMVLFVLLALFLGLTLESTWAADYLTQSDRHPVIRAACYLELYPPAAALLVWCLIVLVLEILQVTQRFARAQGVPALIWIQLLSPIGFGTALVGLAHAGVIRRWHPAVRAAIYVVLLSFGVAWMLWIRALML
jgi:hypothetical protein